MFQEQAELFNIKLSSKEHVLYQIHGHPLFYDESGHLIEVGTPQASEEDMRNIVGTNPNIVLGYKQHFKAIHGTTPTQFESVEDKYIGFYNKQHYNFEPVEFSIFERAVRKINAR